MSAIVRTEDFQEYRSRVLFDCLLGLHVREVPIDFLTVGETLRADGKFEQLGGAQWLRDLALAVTSAAHARQHAQMVAEDADLRRAHAKAQEVTECSDRESLRRVTRELQSIAERDGTGPRAVPLSSLCLADVEPRAVEWLWPGLIPFGKLTVLVGPPGVGKSSVARDLAARVTVGGKAPGGESLELGAVLYVAGEEDPGDTLRPSIDAAGGDARYVHVITDPPSMPEQADRLRAVIERLNAEGPPVRMLIVDTVADVLGRADDSKNVDVRRVLQPLRQLAEHYRIAVLLVAHTRKAGGTTMAGRVMGSTAFVALARSVVAVVPDPQASRGGRIVAQVKTNVAGSDGRAWTMRLEGAPVRVLWTGRRQVDEAEMLGALEPQPSQRPRDQATEFLLETLEAGPVAAAEVLRRATERGFSQRTIDRAKRELEVVARKVGMHRGWTWELPQSAANSATLRVVDDWRSSKAASSEAVASTEGRQFRAAGEAGSLPTDTPQHSAGHAPVPIASVPDRGALTPSAAFDGGARADRGDECEVPADIEERAASQRNGRPHPIEPDVRPGELFGDESAHYYEGH